jgi:hypothetical protein
MNAHFCNKAFGEIILELWKKPLSENCSQDLTIGSKTLGINDTKRIKLNSLNILGAFVVCP